MKAHPISICGQFALAVLLTLLITGIVRVTPARAAGIVVNSSADTVAGSDGLCTLREAIAAAVSDLPSGAAAGECAAGNTGTDEISFAGNYTITLGDQLPLITTAMTITGLGAANTIIQAAASPNHPQWRVFQVSPAGSLTLDQVTVRNGFCGGSCAGGSDANPEFGEFGGGILNEGTVTLRNSTIAGNEATGGGGVYNRGTLTMTNTMFTDNEAAAGRGGGVYSTGTLTVTDSTFLENIADTEAGIYSTGPLTVTSSSFSGNHAFTGSGGLLNGDVGTVTNSTFSGNRAGDGAGGGIVNTGTLTVTNSTISGNQAWAGGGIDNYRTLVVINSTVSGNTVTNNQGSGIYSENPNGASAVLKNTILANDPGSNCFGTITNGSSNLDSGASCGWGSESGSLSNTDPGLGPLADNGGPTQTMALLPGSPAIDHANDADCPSTDQRSVPRPQDGNGDGIATCDMGAYELETSAVLHIEIDIRPGSSTNPINLGARGVIPVAVLTTPGFNAATLDPATVILAGAPPLRWSQRDVDHDGTMDLLFQFEVRKLQLTRPSVEASLTGETYDGLQVLGTDKVKIVPGAAP
ncbi:MAG: choice-of-anchor Q domain-containing protein [Bacteroidota bacterium]